MVLCAVVLVLMGAVWIGKRKSLSPDMRKILGIIAFAALLGGAAGITENQSPVLLEGNQLERNKNGAGDYEEQLQLYIEDMGERLDYPVEIPEQSLTLEEEREILAAAKEELTQEFPGENSSVNCIRERVVIRDSYQDGKVAAEWSFDNYRVMDLKGNVVADDLSEEGELVKARVELYCGTSNSVEEFYFQVFPAVLDERERLLHQLEQMIEQEREVRGAQFLKLPEAVGEYRLEWKAKRDYTPEKILILGGVLAAFVPVLERSRRQEQQKKRNCLLEIEYPDMVSKMALLLSAGMTLQGAWKRIVFSYEEKRKNPQKGKMPVYEEMLLTCHEIENGVGEQRAYERFGERCGQAGYRRFGNILAQNLRKGNQGIVVLLEQEAENAFEERKRAAKRYGEEAGTRLLLPMMLMLGIVMVILLIPAILTFQIS